MNLCSTKPDLQWQLGQSDQFWKQWNFSTGIHKSVARLNMAFESW